MAGSVRANQLKSLALPSGAEKRAAGGTYSEVGHKRDLSFSGAFRRRVAHFFGVSYSVKQQISAKAS